MSRYEKEFRFIFWLHLAMAILSALAIIVVMQFGLFVIIPIAVLLYSVLNVRFMYVTITNTRQHDQEPD